MSTADSLTIAISQLVTVECVWPLKKKARHSTLAWIGRLTSLASTIIALLLGIRFSKSGVSALTAINFPFIIQAVPTYINGLFATEYGELHPVSRIG
jgi:Na+/proline symporter